MSPQPERRLHLAATGGGRPSPEERGRALELARARVVAAPAVLGARPWRLELHPDRLALRADRTRQPTAPDATGRLLVESAGAALFSTRVALAASGWASDVERFPRPDDPDLLAEIGPVRDAPDPSLAALEPGLHRWRAGRPRSPDGQLPGRVLRRLTEIAERDGIVLVPVVHEAHRQLVARLTQPATRRPEDGPGTETSPAPDATGPRTTVLLATRTDDELAWLRTGEALQHLLLELARLDRTAVLLPEAIEVPLARVQLRAAFTWDAHPQLLLRIGSAGPDR